MTKEKQTGLHVYEAITAVTLEMSKEGIAKDRKNQQQGYNFRGIDDVYNALSPILSKNKLCIMPKMMERDITERATQKGGVLFYVTVKAEFDFVSAIDGSSHTVITYGEAMDSGDKATNKAMSAAYKYAAFQTFCIPTEGDNDADATTHNVVPSVPQQLKVDNREAAADLWPVPKQEEWYKAADTMFSGDLSVDVLNAWFDTDKNGQRISLFHDAERGAALHKAFMDALTRSATYEIDEIDGLNELQQYWTKQGAKFKRAGNQFATIEQAKNTRKAQLNASA